MLLKNYPEKYSNEIVGSYFLADKKKLLDENQKIIELFRIVDYRQCSDLLNSFDRYFKLQFESEMKSQKFWYEFEEENRPTFEELDKRFQNQFKSAVEIFEKEKNYNIAGTDLFLFDVIQRKEYINLSQSEKEKYYSEASIQIKAELLKEKQSGFVSFGKKVELSNLIETLKETDVRVVHRARLNILNDFLGKIFSGEIKIEDVINKSYE